MIVKDYVKRFEKLGMGMFVHFGLYSLAGKGEWSYRLAPGVAEIYPKLFSEFNPKPDWAKKLVATAKRAGCKYITLTTRHHDGFSLFDTKGLNDYDAPHTPAGRDLVREFVDECRAADIIPFFYHTLLDWHHPDYEGNFPSYLAYLRESVKLLCTEYGPIGGIWFDGKWNKPNEDWEEDALYSTIRKYQPEAMIINNTGLSKRGELGHIELDSVTFERGKPKPLNLEDSPKYVASEMCQVLGTHWGFAQNDFSARSVGDLIGDLVSCRRYGSNFLLNVGPTGEGYVPELDTAVLHRIGDWVAYNEPALRLPRPTDITVEGKEQDFLLFDGKDTYYLFAHGINMSADPNVQQTQAALYEERFNLDRRIKSAEFLHTGEALSFEEQGNAKIVRTKPYPYGSHMVIGVVRIVCYPND